VGVGKEMKCLQYVVVWRREPCVVEREVRILTRLLSPDDTEETSGSAREMRVREIGRNGSFDFEM
jgi:hypothetical protein